jgi:hypothetical protein
MTDEEIAAMPDDAGRAFGKAVIDGCLALSPITDAMDPGAALAALCEVLLARLALPATDMPQFLEVLEQTYQTMVRRAPDVFLRVKRFQEGSL